MTLDLNEGERLRARSTVRLVTWRRFSRWEMKQVLIARSGVIAFSPWSIGLR
jgi:hypothetical protein